MDIIPDRVSDILNLLLDENTPKSAGNYNKSDYTLISFSESEALSFIDGCDIVLENMDICVYPIFNVEKMLEYIKTHLPYLFIKSIKSTPPKYIKGFNIDYPKM